MQSEPLGADTTRSSGSRCRHAAQHRAPARLRCTAKRNADLHCNPRGRLMFTSPLSLLTLVSLVCLSTAAADPLLSARHRRASEVITIGWVRRLDLLSHSSHSRSCHLCATPHIRSASASHPILQHSSTLSRPLLTNSENRRWTNKQERATDAQQSRRFESAAVSLHLRSPCADPLPV